MILETRAKLRAIQRSLDTVIIPAIPAEAGQAREQAQFAAMHCGAMLAQVNWEYAMEVAEAGHFAALCRSLGSIAAQPIDPALDASLAHSDGFVNGPPASHEAVREVVLALRSAADRLLEIALASGSSEISCAATQAVLAAARRHEIRTRAWVQDASYETGEVAAATIEDSLDPERLDALLA